MKRIHLVLLLACLSGTLSKKSGGPIEEISDAKELKKILRTKTNVLVCYINSQKAAGSILKVMIEAADIVRGQGTILQVDCAGEGKKLCKKMKVGSEGYSVRHYKEGEFHKIYDRKETVASLVAFMRDPTGDAPWDEDDTTTDIVHIPDPQFFSKFLKKENGPTMVMFYAPWCGFCKQLKPEYSAAATELKGIAVMAAVDVSKPENAILRMKFNITGFPTLHYFEGGEFKFTYDGDNKKAQLISFMKNPSEEPVRPKEEDWSQTESDVVHLTTESFDSFTARGEPTLVMFYAPWCGHCKRLKPEYEKAAAIMKSKKIVGSLAAVDCTKETQLAKRFSVKSYPQLKFFSEGELRWDVPGLRDSAKLVEFMESPSEPPPPPPPEPAWQDQPSEVIHLTDETFKQVLKKKRHALVMFYAPWCGHCKAAKPEFTAAAEETKDNPRLTFAAVDCTKHSSVCSAASVSGYPTFKYYHYYNKAPVGEYNAGRQKGDFVSFLEGREPKSAGAGDGVSGGGVGSGEPGGGDGQQLGLKWGEGESDVIHLTTPQFLDFLKANQHVLVMFYLPGCLQCKQTSMSFGTAAKEMKAVKFAAVNAANEETLVRQLGIPGFPWFKYYSYGNSVESDDFSGFNTKQKFITFLTDKMASKTKPGTIREEL